MDTTEDDYESRSPTVSQQRQPTAIEQERADRIRRTYVRFNFQLYVEMGEKRNKNENHEKRMQNIRRELDLLKNTEWQYDSIEKHIGQA